MKIQTETLPAGGAMVRIILPGGVGITHEWADEKKAMPQINAALYTLASERTSAKGVGTDD